MLRETVSGRAELEEMVPIAPELADFSADFVIRAPHRRPVGVFLGTSEGRVLEAVIVQMRALHEAHIDCAVIALIERGKNIPGTVRRTATNRLTAVAEFRDDEVAAIQRIANEAIGQALH
jgi:hypothetical protein